MDAEGLDLARKLVALPGWRWMEGMAWRSARPGAQALSAQQGRVCGLVCGVPPEGAIPELDDDGMGGCLLAMLGEDRFRIRMYRDGFAVSDPDKVERDVTSLGRACASIMVERGWVSR